MKFHDFIIPTHLDEALKILQELGDKATPVAGGTAFHFYSGDKEKIAVDITRLGLNSIQLQNTHVRIGATVTVDGIRKFQAQGWVLDEVAKYFATQQIRNISTLGGNIAQVFPWADFPVALLALQAKIEIKGKEDSDFMAEEYFRSQPAKLFQKGDLLTYIEVPLLSSDSGFGYHKEVRTASGFSLLTSAAFIKLADQTIQEIRIAVGASVPFPKRLKELEKVLLGKSIHENFEEAIKQEVAKIKWQGKEGMSNEYAQHLASVVIQDVLSQAIQRAKGEGR